jgi:hypothetical protein
MPMELKVVSGSHTKRRFDCKPSFHSLENGNPGMRIRVQFLVHTHVVGNVMVQLLTLRIEIRMIKIQEDLTFLDSSCCDWISGVGRVEYGSTVSLKSKQVAVLLLAGVENHRLF